MTITEPDGTETVIEDVPVDEDGNWTVPGDQLPELPDGDTTIEVVQTDPAGNVSEPTEVVVTVDTAAPDAPVVTEVDGQPVGEDGSVDTNNPLAPIAGTAEPGTTVDVTVTNPDGTETVYEDVPVGEDGTWSLTPTTPLQEGDSTVTVIATDDAGNTSPASEPVVISLDTQAPDAPVITAPADGDTVGTGTPTITGTGEPGATVDLVITPADGSEPIVVEDIPVDSEGNWSHTPTEPLPDGDYTTEATQTDDAGNTSPASEPVEFTVDSTAVPPVIDTVDGRDTSEGGTIRTNEDTPAIAGSAEPGDGVTVRITDADGTVVAEGPATVDETTGDWTFTPSTPLPDGSYTIVATSTDDAGNTATSDPVQLVVDTTAEPPVVTGVGGQPVGDDGRVLTNDGTPTIEGTAEPGATIELVIDGVPVVTDEPIVADENGNSSYTPSEPLGEGEHTVEVTQTDRLGNESAPAEVTVVVDTRIGTPEITSPGDGDTVTDSTPVIEGTGDPGDTITVIIDGEEVGETTVDEDGTWTFTPEVPLSEGEHTIEVVATDEAGNTATSDPVQIVVDAVVPAPQITDPSDGDEVGPNPTVSGTGRPGATVTVYVNGQEVGTATVGEDGTWEFPVSTGLTCGTQATITASQTVPDGDNARAAARTSAQRTSAMSEPVTVSVACADNAGSGPIGNTGGGDASDDGDGGLLPDTGAPQGLAALAGLGLGALVVGGLMLVRRRRA